MLVPEINHELLVAAGLRDQGMRALASWFDLRLAGDRHGLLLEPRAVGNASVITEVHILSRFEVSRLAAA